MCACYLNILAIRGYYYLNMPVQYFIGEESWNNENTIVFDTIRPSSNTYVWHIDEKELYEDDSYSSGNFFSNPDFESISEYYRDEKFGEIKYLLWTSNRKKIILITKEEKELFGVGKVENNKIYTFNVVDQQMTEGPTGKDISQNTNYKFLFIAMKASYFELINYLGLALSSIYILISKRWPKRRIFIALLGVFLTVFFSHISHGGAYLGSG